MPCEQCQASILLLIFTIGLPNCRVPSSRGSQRIKEAPFRTPQRLELCT